MTNGFLKKLRMIATHNERKKLFKSRENIKLPLISDMRQAATNTSAVKYLVLFSDEALLCQHLPFPDKFSLLSRLQRQKPHRMTV